MSTNCTTTRTTIDEKEITSYILPESVMAQSAFYSKIDDAIKARKKIGYIDGKPAPMSVKSYEISGVNFLAPPKINGEPRLSTEYTQVSPSGCAPCDINQRPNSAQIGSWVFHSKQSKESDPQIIVPATVTCSVWYVSNQSHASQVMISGALDENENEIDPFPFKVAQPFSEIKDVVDVVVKVNLDTETSKYRRTSTQSVNCSCFESLVMDPLVAYL